MDLDRTYERFRGGPFVGYHLRYHVTLARSGMLRINSNLYRAWGKPTGVYLYYSRENDKIALVPTTPRGSEAFPIKQIPGDGFAIYATTFLRHFGLRFDATRKFVNPELREDGKLLLDLSNTIVVTKARRKRNR